MVRYGSGLIGTKKFNEARRGIHLRQRGKRFVPATLVSWDKAGGCELEEMVHPSSVRRLTWVGRLYGNASPACIFIVSLQT
jgi:hypothetical protein